MRRIALVLALCLFPLEASAVFSARTGAVLAFRPSTIYVSNTTANGIPAGSDFGPGSRSRPYATIEKALSRARASARILCNSGTYTPPTYWAITKSITIDSVVAQGCVLRAQAAQTNIITLLSPSSSAITIGSVLLDANNTAGHAIEIIDKTTDSLTFRGTRILNPVNYGINGSGTGTKARVALYNFVLDGVTTKSALYLPVAGFVDVDILSPVVTINGNAPAANQGVFQVSAIAAGSQFYATNVNVSVTTTSVLAAYFRAVQVENIPNALISGGTISMVAASANVNCDAASVSFNPSIPVDASGGIVENLIVTHDCAGGGHGVLVGVDGDPGVSLRGYVNGGIIRNNKVTGTTASQTATLHGVLCGWQTVCTVYRNKMDMTNLAYVLKGMTGTLVYSNLDTRTTGKSYYQKGGSAAKFIHNTSYQQATGAYRPTAFFFGDDGSGTGPATTGVLKGNAVFHDDATSSGTFVSVDATSDTPTASYNDYFATKPRAAPWVRNVTNYALLADWQAIEATATGANPSLNTASANLPLLVQSSVVAKVPADATVTVDYVGNAYNSPAAMGANETVFVPKDVADFTSLSSLPAWITLTRASAGTYIDGSGNVVSATTNAIRLNHNPVTPFAQTGLLLEPAGTNLFLQSGFASGWTATNGVLGGGSQTGPDGVASSAKSFIEDSTAAAVHGIQQSVNVTSGSTYTVSVWAKAISADGWLQIRLPAGQFGATTVVNYQLSGACAIGTIGVNATGSGCIAYPNGYYRMWITAPATVTAAAIILFYVEALNNTPTHNGDGVSGAYLWCPQMEVDTAPSTCIATTTAPVTRAADVPALTGIGATDMAAGPSSYFATNPNTGASSDAGFTAGGYVWPAAKSVVSNVTIYNP